MSTIRNVILVKLITAAVAPASAASLRDMAIHWAPIVYQDTSDGWSNNWRNRRYDLITRYDFDGNSAAGDNWANAATHALPAFVYYEAFETETHVFLIYGLYHPRDWEAFCFHPLCHENDQENYRLTIAKDGSEFGSPILLDGDTHGFHKAHAIGSTVRSGRTRLAKGAPGFAGSHFLLFVEARGHGPHVCADDTDCRSRIGGNDGVIYRPTADGSAPGVGEVDVREVGVREAEYGLLPSFEELWPHAAKGDDIAFDNKSAVAYRGRRFTLGHKVPTEYNSDEFGSQGDGHLTWGVQFVSGGRDRLLDWGLDVALSVKEHFAVAGEDDPAQWSMTYTCHPYLGVFASCPERAPSNLTRSEIDYVAPLGTLLAGAGLRVPAGYLHALLGMALSKALQAGGVPQAAFATAIPSPSITLETQAAGWDWKLTLGVEAAALTPLL